MFSVPCAHMVWVQRAQNAEDVEVQGFSLPSVESAISSMFAPLAGGGGWVDVVAEWYNASSGWKKAAPLQQ